MSLDYDSLHLAALDDGRDAYIDPVTGYSVFTALAHEKRGRCCGCGCRHCPYGYTQVSGGRIPKDPFLQGDILADEVDVLSWSGGKDSYLALRNLLRSARRPVVLLTTFDGSRGVVAHQEVEFTFIHEQARALELPLVLVPLLPGGCYTERLRLGLRVIARHAAVARLCFGDLHLADIRAWREREVGPAAAELGASLYFPIWHADYRTLAAELDSAPVTVTLSSVQPEYASILRVGEPFDAELRDRLPEQIDAFGERGEFHTRVLFEGKPSRGVYLGDRANRQ